jgi:sugar (pentulose or hexulose) kinase
LEKIFQAPDAILAVDIGGTNIRAGIVYLTTKRAEDFSKAKVGKFELWRHGDEKLSRDDAVQELVQMVRRLARALRRKAEPCALYRYWLPRQDRA